MSRTKKKLGRILVTTIILVGLFYFYYNVGKILFALVSGEVLALVAFLLMIITYVYFDEAILKIFKGR